MTTEYDAVTNTCEAPVTGEAGYATYVEYTMKSYFDVTITNLPVNETFGPTSPNYTGEDWSVLTAGPPDTDTGDGTFADEICEINPTGKPHSQKPQSPLGTTMVQNASQGWRVGGSTNGQGVLVQTDTCQMYQDHGAHLNIMSPP